MSHYVSDEDEDLKKAIALSMQDTERFSSPSQKQTVVLDLTSDEETDDLDPVVVPKQKISNGTIKPENENIKKLSEPYGLKSTESPISGLGGFDRKKMEEERLARAAKRKAPISPPTIQRESVRHGSRASHDLSASLSEQTERRPSKKIMLSSSSISEISSQHNNSNVVSLLDDDELSGMTNRKLMNAEPTTLADIDIHTNPTLDVAAAHQAKMPDAQSFTRQQAQLGSGIQYPRGTVKQTWAYGFPRVDDIKIEEVLQKADLDLAVLSSFQWDEEWILSKLDMKRTKLICVVQAKGVEQKEVTRKNAPSNTRFCFPPMDGQINSMHSKLQLLAHPSHLRVVVPSANLVPYDWGETGVMENTVFLIDLPRLAGNRVTSVGELTPFGRELRNFLKAMEMDSKILDSLLKFDFSQTKNLAFVHTIGGSHSGGDWKTTGYPGLGSAIRELGLSNDSRLNVTAVSASIGSLTHDFIKAILLACKGDSGLTELTWRTSGPAAARKCTPEEQVLLMEIEEGFRIMFPSRETIEKSKGGLGCGGTICFQSQWYNKETFPKELLFDCKSKRTGLLMHSKLFFTAPANLNASGSRNSAWAYVGSANLSESAWGRLVKDRSTKQPKLNCRNWECGVVIPVRSSAALEPLVATTFANGPQETTQEQYLDSTFDGVVPVPMVTPGAEYGENGPWFFMEG